jgi:ATP-dependent helicase/DNAse subunit B
MLGARMGVSFYQFYSLARETLDRAGDDISIISTPGSRRIVTSLLHEMQARGELSSFASVWDKRGFIQVILEWLREMKSQGIGPEHVKSQASRYGRPRDQQLALIYSRYQAFLHEKRLMDRDGSLWLAADALEENITIFSSSGLFLALGFDQFSPHQVRILEKLAARILQLGVYLSWDVNREPGSVALARLAQTRSILEERLALRVEQIETEMGSPSEVRRLREEIFKDEPGASAEGAREVIRLISAPSRDSEARWALREVKQMLLEGTSPHQIAILAPSPGKYIDSIRAAADEYGVPVQCEEKLLANPAAAALVNLLSLFPDFPWRQTIDALNSPYFQHPLSREQVGLIDRLSRKRPVVRGLEQWRAALQPVKRFEIDLEEEDRLSSGPAVTIPVEELKLLERDLFYFFDLLTPLPEGTYEEYAQWIKSSILGYPALNMDFEKTRSDGDGSLRQAEGDIKSLRMLEACLGAGDQYALRDLNALKLVLEHLGDLLKFSEIQDISRRSSTTWDKFNRELLAQLANVSMLADNSPVGVHFGHLSVGRGLPIESLFVLGMGEGEFPSLPPPDIFYSQEERFTSELPLVRQQPAEDASLWWQVLGSPRTSLVVLRSWLDDNGAEWLPSPYWEAVREVFPGLSELRLPAVERPRISTAASGNELLTALALDGASAAPPEIDPSWQAAWRSFRVMESRWKWGMPGVYEGCFRSPDLKAEIAQRFGPRFRWSCSKLSKMAKCPYSFFAEVVLELQPLHDPVEGYDALQQGRIVHAILELLHGQLKRSGTALITDNQDSILKVLEENCEKLFAAAPEHYGFRAGVLWFFEQKELRRILENLVRWECEQDGGQSRFFPYLQEVKFGLKGSSVPALTLESSTGLPYEVSGIIDRIDREASGALRVIDYKTGSQKFSYKDIQVGLALQTALYPLAVQSQMTGSARVEESYYLLVGKREMSGKLKFAGRVDEDGIVQNALEAAGVLVTEVQEARFPSYPAKPGFGKQQCSQGCDYSALCRISRRAIQKARARD